jgi:serine phosphatase RsbU (regulator of sigma subunit)
VAVEDAFHLTAASLPYLVLALGLMVLGIVAVVARGDGVQRMAVLGVVAASLPWAVGSFFMLGTDDPHLAETLGRLWLGPAALLGPSLMTQLLVVGGLHERHRAVIVGAVAIGAAVCILTWSTNIVVRGIWRTPWGIWYPEGGGGVFLLVLTLVFGPILAAVLARRARMVAVRGVADAQKRRLRFVLLPLLLMPFGATDVLLLWQLGVYPWSVVPGIFATGGALYAISRHNLWHLRGIDRAGLVEVAAVSAVVAISLGAAWALEGVTRESAVALAVMLAPVLLAAQLVSTVARSRQDDATRVAGEADIALEEFVEASSNVRDEGELSTALGELLAGHTGLVGARLIVVEAGGLRPFGNTEAEPIRIDARVRAWLVTNPEMLMVGELAPRRLGGLREPVEGLIARVGAEVIVPLVDREELVGVIAADGGRTAMRDDTRSLIAQAARATAMALTYLRLFREAEARVTVAREVEVASAVQQARATGETRLELGSSQVIAYYRPSTTFGGDWWSAHELPDGRVLVAIGDVSGGGVPVALLSSTVEGTVETAQRLLGASFELEAFLQLLNHAVLDVGGGRYTMTCFAALFDRVAGLVTFANAGHPFPYVCRTAGPATAPGGLGSTDGPADLRRVRGDLRALVARGTPLGVADPVLAVSRLELRPDDVVVFYTSALVDARNGEGKSYGERRFQRVLRDYVRGAGERACQVIVDDVQAYRGEQPIDQDLTLVVVRMSGRANSATTGRIAIEA